MFLGPSLFSDSVDFSYSGGSFFVFEHSVSMSGSFFVFFSGIFHASSTVLFLFLVLFFLAGLLCILRMHALIPV